MYTEWKEKIRVDWDRHQWRKDRMDKVLEIRKYMANTIKINDIRHLRWKEKKRVNGKDNNGKDRMDQVLEMSKSIAAQSGY